MCNLLNNKFGYLMIKFDKCYLFVCFGSDEYNCIS